MMYDQSDGGLRFRKFCTVSLGWWHTYKHVALKIWDTFAETIWAPLFHFLYPGVKFFRKSKALTHVLALYQCCMEGYKDICQPLRELAEDPAVSTSVKMAIRELLFVFDFALPVVTLTLLSCFRSDVVWLQSQCHYELIPQPI
jgi:hypothetical protein